MLLDWKVAGSAYVQAMIVTARRLADEFVNAGVPVFAVTESHHAAVPARRYGGGQAAARRLRRANLLTYGIGLPIEPIDGDLNGLRLGTREIVRRGVTEADVPVLASFNCTRPLRRPGRRRSGRNRVPPPVPRRLPGGFGARAHEH